MKQQVFKTVSKIKAALIRADKKVLVGLFLVMVMATALRAYRFEEFLLFKADQARDAYLAKDVLEKGVGYLPLLGPKAGDSVVLEGDDKNGDMLRLGPAYYYIQYVAVFLFQSVHPWVLALPDLVLSIFSVGLSYLLFRQIFSKITSLSLTALVASSFFLVQYSRFAWNTNQIIFWELLFSLSLLKVVSSADRKKAGWWLVSSGFLLAIITQLHFLGFLGYSAVAALFLFFYRPKGLPKKFWLATLGIFLIVNLPMILSDVYNNGDNVKRFFAVVDQQKESEQFFQRISNTFTHHGKFYILALSSFTRQEVEDIPEIGVWFLVLTIGVFLVFVWKDKQSAKNLLQRNPLAGQLILWAVIFFGLYFGVSDKLVKTRYWLLTAIIPFMVLGLWFTLVEKIFSVKKSRFFILAASGLLVVANLSASGSFFTALDRGTERVPGRDDVSYGVFIDLVTYGQMKRSMQWMAEKSKAEQKMMCYRAEEYQERKAYKFLAQNYYQEIYQEEADEGCIFFVISKGKEGNRSLDDTYLEKYEITGVFQDKATVVFSLKARKPLPSAGKKVVEQELEGDDISQKATYWKDLR